MEELIRLISEETRNKQEKFNGNKYVLFQSTCYEQLLACYQCEYSYKYLFKET